jgi:hypothetical protein
MKFSLIPALRPVAALAVLIAIGTAPGARAADAEAPIHGETVGGPVTPFSIDVDLRDLPTVRAWRPGDPIHDVPRRSYPGPGTPLAPDSLAPADPLIPIQEKVPPPAVPGAFATPLVNVAGQGYSGFQPPDTVGDVGLTYFIQAINATNTAFTVYSKTGAVAAGPTGMNSLASAGSPCQTSGGDPIVLYDRLANRWFLLEFASAGNHLCMYISKTADPVAGGWWFYQYDPAVFPDYPHCAIWGDAFYCTTNENSPTIYAFDRANMLNGATARAAQKFTVPALANYTFNVVAAANYEGVLAPPAGAPIPIIRHDDDEAHVASPDATHDFLDLWQLHIDWTTPASSVLTTLPKVAISEYNSWLVNYTTFNAIPQPGSARLLGTMREIMSNKTVYRNFGTHEVLVGSFETNLNPARSGGVVNAGQRWFELRRTPPGSGSWTLFQEGTFLPGNAAENRWTGAIDMDQDGNIAFGYNLTRTTAPAEFAGLKYTGRLAADAPGTFTQGETPLVAGLAANTQNNSRWGDYSAMGLDPSDNCTFWFTGEYLGTGNQWLTQIAAFKFSVLPGATAITQAKSSSDVQINWSPAVNAVAYTVQRADTPNAATWTVVGNGITAPGFSDPGQLASAVSRFYIVNAYTRCGGYGP